MHRETRPESWLDTPLETPADRRPETLGDTLPSADRPEWTTARPASPGDTGSMSTDDVRGAATERPGNRVVLGDDADEPEPFDAFRRPGADQRGLGYGNSNGAAPLAAPDSGPYVPEPALRPLPPGVAQEERRAGGRLGRSLRPFSRGRTAPDPADEFPRRTASTPAPPPRWEEPPAAAPRWSENLTSAAASRWGDSSTPPWDDPTATPPRTWGESSAPDAGQNRRRARHGLEPATDSDLFPSAETTAETSAETTTEASAEASTEASTEASADRTTKRRGWRRSRPAPVDEPASAPAPFGPALAERATIDAARAASGASPGTSEPVGESKRAARKRKKDEEFVDWVSGLGGE